MASPEDDSEYAIVVSMALLGIGAAVIAIVLAIILLVFLIVAG
jgi:hypothetical protein